MNLPQRQQKALLNPMKLVKFYNSQGSYHVIWRWLPLTVSPASSEKKAISRLPLNSNGIGESSQRLLAPLPIPVEEALRRV